MAIIRAYLETPYGSSLTPAGTPVWGPDLSAIPEARGWVLIAADRVTGTGLVLAVIENVTRGQLESPRGFTVLGLDELDGRNRRARIPDAVRDAVVQRAASLGRSGLALERFDVNPPGVVL